MNQHYKSTTAVYVNMARFEFQRVEAFLARSPDTFGTSSSPCGSASLASLKARATGIDCLCLKHGKVASVTSYHVRYFCGFTSLL